MKSMKQRRFERAIRQAQRKACESGELNLVLVDIHDWLIALHGDNSREEWLSELLCRYEDEHPEIQPHFYINLSTASIMLDDIAIEACRSVLEGFCGAEACEQVYNDLKEKNTEIRFWQALRHTLHTYPHSLLKQLRDVWELHEPSSDEGRTIQSNILVLLALELGENT